MDLIIPHRATYEFEGRATVSEIAKSLIAQDKLFREALLVLEEVFPKLEFESVRVDVREVTQSSPFKTFMQGIVVGAYSPGLGEDMPDILNTLFGANVPDSYDSIVSVLILLIAVWGVDKVRAKLFPGKAEPDILSERERLLVAAASQASVTRDHMEEALENVLSKHKRSVMRAASDFVAPAKRLNASAISVPGEEIGKKAIDAMPSEVDFAQYEPPTEMTPLSGVTVHFRAHDLDRNKHWAATIREVSPDRKPLHLAPHIQSDQLFERSEIKADVLVTAVRDAEGEYIPSLYYLEKVYDDEPSQSP